MEPMNPHAELIRRLRAFEEQLAYQEDSGLINEAASALETCEAQALERAARVCEEHAAEVTVRTRQWAELVKAARAIRALSESSRPADERVENGVKYERRPELDRRIDCGDDFAGDAWVRWTVPGHTPYSVKESAGQAETGTANRVSESVECRPGQATDRLLRDGDDIDGSCSNLSEHVKASAPDSPVKPAPADLSATPRTDKEEFPGNLARGLNVVRSTFARSLERDLQEAVRVLRWLRSDHDYDHEKQSAIDALLDKHKGTV